MSRPPTLFDSPQFPLVPDAAGRRWYANVDNEIQLQQDLSIGDDGHWTHNVNGGPVAVPTGLFTIMKGVLKIPIDREVKLFLFEYEYQQFVLGLEWGDPDTDYAYLWTYTYAALPGMFKR